MMGRDGIWLHAGSRLWLGSISDPAKRSPLGGIASPTQCLSRERQGWVKRSADPTPARHGLPMLGLRLRLDPTYAYATASITFATRSRMSARSDSVEISGGATTSVSI